MSAATAPHRQLYACTRCGNCCRWPGMVKVGPAEIARMAAHLGLTEEAFIERYTRLRDDRRGLTLTERPDGACILLEGDRHCRVNPVKPEQCVGFPNTWSFPGFEEQCPAVKLRYTLRRWSRGTAPPRRPDGAALTST